MTCCTSAPALKIIASSREPLGVAGEVVYRTPPLAESESTQLFVERARLANPQFKLTDANTASIAQICARLDGIPLAIELAAARSRLLSPEQIAARLDDRFRLLVGGSRTALPRQQTLRALIDWSYDLLTDGEKQLLRTASVFIGGWTLDALEAVSGDPQDWNIWNSSSINRWSLPMSGRMRCATACWRPSASMRARNYSTHRKLGQRATTTFSTSINLSEEMWETFRSLKEYSLLTR